MIKHYNGNITPAPNVIFVFGSNPQGRHGAGAALAARRCFGAEYGVGEGLTGNAYALPTKELRLPGTRTISSERITESIRTLYKVASMNPDKEFHIAYRNTGSRSLNGYTGFEMIRMFLAAGPIPRNIVISQEWFNTRLFNVQE